jgi:hypothetical protein
MDSSPTPVDFALAARRVAWRVGLRRWLALLRRTVAWVAAGAGILIAASWLLGVMFWAVMAWCIVMAWLLGCLGWTWQHRPPTYSALALWDQQAGRREAFASAWWFQQQPAATRSARATAHIATQQAQLAAALAQMPAQLPVRVERILALPFAIVLMGTVLIQTLRPGQDVLLVDAPMAAAAKAEAEKLSRSGWEKKQLAGLNEEESQALEELKKGVQEAAEILEKAAGQDARGIISDLEKRAREAEKLAARLAADKDAWASEALIRSLRSHADTADVGDAVAARNPTQTATAAEKLARQLSAPQLSRDATERLTQTLKDHAQSAESADRTRLVGQHVIAASEKMSQKQPAAAGAEFDKLAEAMRDQARRDEARNQLEKLAQQLRDAGSSMAGQNQAGEMQQMAAAGQDGQSGQQPSSGQTPQVPQAGQQPPGAQSQPQIGQAQQQMQAPGLGQMGQQQMMQQMPVPGTGQQQRLMIQPGQQGQKPQEGQPMLFAPIPGQPPGDKPDAFFLGPPGQEGQPGPMITMSTPGGKEPGVGKADLNAEATAAQKSSNQAVVSAQQNQEGASTSRSVEGGARPEAAARQASQVVLEAIAAEEAALDEAALPPSRREQVRRYFTELRRRFEKE